MLMLVKTALLAVAGGESPTIWNQTDVGSYIVIENAGRDIDGNGSFAGRRGARSVASKTTGKFHWEVEVLDTTPSFVGVANGSVSLDNFLGALSGGTGYHYNGTVYNNGGTQPNLATGFYAAGDVIGVAVDVGNRIVWFRKNGTWNGDPAAGTGGVSFAHYTGAVYAAASIDGAASSTSSVLRARFDPSQQSYAAPPGFTAGFPAS